MTRKYGNVNRMLENYCGDGMKIGIITFNDTTNYGAALQTFALNKKISDMGYESETIRYNCENIRRREIPSKFKNVHGIKAKVIWSLTIAGRYKKYKYIKTFFTYKKLNCGKNY